LPNSEKEKNKMTRKMLYSLIALLVATATILSACGPVPTPITIVGTKEVQVVVTTTPEPPKKQLEIFHWWTAPGEREAADAMFAAMNTTYPDIEVVENPVSGGGGTELRTVLKARITAGIAPDTFQTTGGAELKAYVDNGVLEPLDSFYAKNDYSNKIPKPCLINFINGHPILFL
jgi:glucose/mannose transport system substrate-binding protein